MNKEKKSRRSFLLKSTAAIAATTFAGWFGFAKHLKKPEAAENNETVKMLTEDGRLVEIDKKRLPSQTRKIEMEELKTWLKK
jgi:hypothetical protein